MKQIHLGPQHGFHVLLSTYGAGIVEFWAPDREGRFVNIALSVEHPDPSYAGLTLGPVAGRIRDAKLIINTNEFDLSKNEGNHHLHGGSGGCSFRHWDLVNHTETEAIFSLSLKDGEDGYPGNRTIQAIYQLQSNNTLSLTYRATTDKPTVFSLSNHTYWNLEGRFNAELSDHLLQMPAEYVYLNDEDHIPIERIKTENTVFDFRKNKPPVPASNDSQIIQERGLNHAFETSEATLSHSKSGRVLKITSDYPCMVVYSGGFLSKSTTQTDKRKIAPSCAIAFEAQELPILDQAKSSQNKERNITLPGEVWVIKIRFQ
ncbi:MAG TPA: hypothetical protein DD633_06625 [Sphaerochaeta sp.]|nr:hypothetical protein [Sphaerochaeta sp.]